MFRFENVLCIYTNNAIIIKNAFQNTEECFCYNCIPLSCI